MVHGRVGVEVGSLVAVDEPVAQSASGASREGAGEDGVGCAGGAERRTVPPGARSLDNEPIHARGVGEAGFLSGRDAREDACSSRVSCARRAGRILQLFTPYPVWPKLFGFALAPSFRSSRAGTTSQDDAIAGVAVGHGHRGVSPGWKGNQGHVPLRDAPTSRS